MARQSVDRVALWHDGQFPPVGGYVPTRRGLATVPVVQPASSIPGGMPPNAFRAQAGYGKPGESGGSGTGVSHAVPADFRSRGRALLVDGAIVVGVVGATWLLLAFVFATDRRCAVTSDSKFVVTTCTDLGTWRPIVVVLAATVGLITGVFTYAVPCARRGASPGMTLAGLKLVDAVCGERIGVARSVGRFLLGAVAGVLSLGGTFVWQLRDDQRRTWHDVVAQTLVVSA